MAIWLEKTVGITTFARAGNVAAALASVGFDVEGDGDPGRTLRSLDAGAKLELFQALAAEGVILGDRQKLKIALADVRDRSMSPAAAPPPASQAQVAHGIGDALCCAFCWVLFLFMVGIAFCPLVYAQYPVTELPFKINN